MNSEIERVAGSGWPDRLQPSQRYAHDVEQRLANGAVLDESRTADEWFAVVSEPLDVSEMYDWAVRADCGAVVIFSGTVRDHSVEGSEVRSGVQFLEYEAYASRVVSGFQAIADQIRSTWPDLGRIGIVHRIGRVELSESSVLVVVSAPHRPEAFAAAEFAIDTLKSSAPIWKHETWDGGSDWGLDARSAASKAGDRTGS